MLEQGPIQKIAHTATIGGAGLATSSGILGWLDLHQGAISSIGVISGVIIGIIGVLINWHYTAKRSKTFFVAKDRRKESMPVELDRRSK
jgi:hypothetical protein